MSLADDLSKAAKANKPKALRPVKLTDEQVIDIRNLDGALPHAAIAEMYGVTRSHVSSIIARRYRR